MKKLLPKLLVLFLCTGCAGAAVPLPGFSPSVSVQQQQVQSVTTVQQPFSKRLINSIPP